MDPIPPTKHARKRAQLARELGIVVLDEGLGALSLRQAATRLGTSDRMLLYYFGTKAGLVAETLAGLSGLLAARFAEIPPGRNRTPAALLLLAASLLANAQTRPFMKLWAEISARGARGEAPFDQVVEQTVHFWLDWIKARTTFPPGVAADDGALALLALLEGLTRLDVQEDRIPRIVAALEHSLGS